MVRGHQLHACLPAEFAAKLFSMDHRGSDAGMTLKDRMALKVGEVIANPVDTPWRIEDPDIEAWALSTDGSTVVHFRKQTDIVMVNSELTRGVTSFAFKIRRSHNNKSHGIYIGVTDAHASRSPGNEESPARRRGSDLLTERGPQPERGGSEEAGDAWYWRPYDGQVNCGTPSAP